MQLGTQSLTWKVTGCKANSSTVVQIIRLTCYWENSGVLSPKLLFILPLS